MKKTVMMVLIVLAAVIFLGTNYALAKGPHGPMKGMSHFDKTDTDHDGNISKKEHMANCEKRFKAMDIDNDGFLTKDECRKAWEKRKQRKMEKRHEKRMKEQPGTLPAKPTDVSSEKPKKNSE